MEFSTTYIAGTVSAITIILPLLGFEIAEKDSLTQTVTEIFGIFGLCYMFYGRYKAGGINIFGVRKKSV